MAERQIDALLPDMQSLQAEMRRFYAEILSELKLVRWIAVTSVALEVVTLVKVFLSG